MGKKMSTLLFIVFCMFGGEFYGQNIYKEHITWESLDIARENMYSDSCHVSELWAIHVYRQEAVGWKCVARGKVYRFARNLTVSAAPLEGKLNFYVQLTSDFDSCTNNFFQVNKLEFVGNLTISEL